MGRITILYVLTGLAVLIAGLLIPYLVHRSGSATVPGWQGLVMPGPLSTKHAFLADKCESCHTPHVGIEATKCITCHADAPALLTRQSTLFHATIGECSGCHIEHEKGVRPVTMDHALLAGAGFHRSVSVDEQTATEKLLQFAAALDLTTDPHKDLSRLNCAECHSNKDPHSGLFGPLCSSCHDVKKWTIAGFQHPSPASNDCAQCHQPPPSHYMEHFRMISAMVAKQEHARVEQCYLCHTTDAWNDIKGVGWYKHH